MEYEEQVRANLKRMETTELAERLSSGALTDAARQIALEELKLRETETGNLGANDAELPPVTPKGSESVSINTPKYALVFALGGALMLAFYLGQLNSELETTVASGFVEGLGLTAILFLVFFTNTALNWLRQKRGKPIRSLSYDAGNIFLVVSVAVILFSAGYMLFS